MNREIKFRGKMIDNGEWVYGDLLQPTEICDIYEIANCESIDGTRYEVIPETIGQFTGLYDNTKKEIYEGDIVKIHKHSYDYGFKEDEIGQIKFLDGAFGFYREKTKNEYYFNDLSTENGYGELEYYEVIGNIYENSELLGGE